MDLSEIMAVANIQVLEDIAGMVNRLHPVKCCFAQ
jgi:hypothetical protein